MSFIVAFRDALMSAECPYSGSIQFETQKYHIFNSEGICRKKCCRYRLFENEIGAHIVCWRRGIDITWFYKDYKLFSDDEKSRFDKERQNQLDLKAKIQQEAILQARECWWTSTEISPEHPYILRKRIIPYGARALNSTILLPCYNQYGEIQSTQRIFPDGKKKFQTSAPFKGTFMPIGEELTPKIMICEGWATGCSIYEATGNMVIVAFSASNMVSIAHFIRNRFKKHLIIYCSDDDEHRVGQENAIKAAKITTGIVILPKFKKEHNENTDFNDIFLLYGMETLQQQLNI